MTMKQIRHVVGNNLILVRDGLLLAFFEGRPFPDMASEAAAVLEGWLNVVPKDALKWARLGASAESGSPANAGTVGRCKGLLNPAKASKTDLTAFKLYGPEPYNPSFQFRVLGTKEMVFKETRKKSNLVEMRFPTDFLEKGGAGPFADLAVGLASRLSFDSGYASLSLNWPTEGRRREAAKIIAPLAMRHPGLDVHMNDATRFRIERRSRGARWLTFLGKELLGPLGGRAALEKSLGQGVQIFETGQGLCLKAGEAPEPGDVNRKDRLPLLGRVEAAIQKVRFQPDPDLRSHMFLDDEEMYTKWENRFVE